MNTYAILVVDDHFQSLIEDAARYRMVGKRGPSVNDRVASAAAGLRRLFATTNTPSSPLPALRDYPYRG